MCYSADATSTFRYTLDQQIRVHPPNELCLAMLLQSLLTAAHKGRYCNKQYVNLGGVVYQHRQEQTYSFVICEKPAAALRIAEALGTANLKILQLDSQYRQKTKKLQNPVFHATDINGNKFVVCSAIGHL
jgi:hypothetical protein